MTHVTAVVSVLRDMTDGDRADFYMILAALVVVAIWVVALTR